MGVISGLVDQVLSLYLTISYVAVFVVMMVCFWWIVFATRKEPTSDRINRRGLAVLCLTYWIISPLVFAILIGFLATYWPPKINLRFGSLV